MTIQQFSIRTQINKTNMSLVPAYASSTDDEDESIHSSEDEVPRDCRKTQHKSESIPIPLPSASLLLSGNIKGGTIGHVFNNPYKEAENAKIASLETHVKMVATEENTQVKNGKKICWNYRKGRCRFGNNCTFAHDEVESLPTIETKEKPKPSEESRHTYANQPNVKKKKRPGLGNSIVPSKKVMKNYHQTKSSK